MTIKQGANLLLTWDEPTHPHPKEKKKTTQFLDNSPLGTIAGQECFSDNTGEGAFALMLALCWCFTWKSNRLQERNSVLLWCARLTRSTGRKMPRDHLLSPPSNRDRDHFLLRLFVGSLSPLNHNLDWSIAQQLFTETTWLVYTR